MEDPEGERTHGTTGTLVMNVQLLLHEGELIAEPVAPPGTALKSFVLAKPRGRLIDAAARMRAQDDLEHKRRQYTRSYEGVKQSDDAFAAFIPTFEALRQDLENSGHRSRSRSGRLSETSSYLLLLAGG